MRQPRMKQWPKNQNKIVWGGDLIGPVAAAFLRAYKLTPRYKRPRDIPYDGYTTGLCEQATGYDPQQQLTAAVQKHREETNGESLLETFLGIAYALGLENGRRMQRATGGSG